MTHSENPSEIRETGGFRRWLVDFRRWFRGLDKRFKVAAAAGLALLVAGVAILGVSLSSGGSGAREADAPANPAAGPSEGPQASPNPLTGDTRPAGKVLAVKIDNVGAATQARHAGLNSADIVYAIQVEGGLSRLMAVYDSNNAPASTGPVRSARETDLPILAGYGKVAFAYSGAAGRFLPDLAKANVFNVTPSTYDGFSNGGSSPTFISPADVFAAFPGAVVAPDIGLRFADAANMPPGGTPSDSFVLRMPAASFGFSWDGSNYLVSTDGRAAVTDGTQPVTATNVIVQHVDIVPGRFADKNDENAVFSQTTGSGEADIYRNGVVYHCTWSKPTDTSPTSYSLNGSPMTLQPGRTWVVLVP
ncbi:MAG TPA: DUF3048 domain-containing protein [Yinghuangia sp.]|nr:DUF3048 domain-containing protein [Yinghuangia sp.]